jgi:hypothetical protein
MVALVPIDPALAEITIAAGAADMIRSTGVPLRPEIPG